MLRILFILTIYLSNPLSLTSLNAAAMDEKVLICGIAKNIEKTVPYLIDYVSTLGPMFNDYRVIIYEDSSTDLTKQLLKEWEAMDPKLLLTLDKFPSGDPRNITPMGRGFRTFYHARARNAALDVVSSSEFDDFKYVIMLDTDFKDWHVKGLIDTIDNPEYEWDAVFASGMYDLFAFRNKQFPIGHELLGASYWENITELREGLQKAGLNRNYGPWIPVYSAFGGLGIYKRDAIIGSRYSGVVTKYLEAQIEQWLGDAPMDCPLFRIYIDLCSTVQIVDIKTDFLRNRENYPDQVGVRLCNDWDSGNIIWFSVKPKHTLPWTCEHVTLHADMCCNGFDRLYINPCLRMPLPPQ